MHAHLIRFHRAQGRDGAYVAAALSEIRAGRKVGHWIWWVFPQLSGLGSSGMSRTYAINGVGEAIEYLQDPVLLERLLEAALAVRHQLARGVPIVSLMGSSIDATKLASSLTLFGHVSEMVAASKGSTQAASLSETAADILRIGGEQGVPPCRYTLAALAEWGASSKGS